MAPFLALFPPLQLFSPGPLSDASRQLSERERDSAAGIVAMTPVSVCFHRGYSPSLFGLFGLLALRLRFRGAARKPPRKPQKGPWRIWPAMENTLCETGVDLRIRSLWPESAAPQLGQVFLAPVEPARGTRESRWRDPAASRTLIRQLMAIVNSGHEYELLRRDLAELDRSYSSSSSVVKGGAASHADNETWLR